MASPEDQVVTLRCGNPQCGNEFPRLLAGLTYRDNRRCPICSTISAIVRQHKPMPDTVLDALANDDTISLDLSLEEKLKVRL